MSMKYLMSCPICRTASEIDENGVTKIHSTKNTYGVGFGVCPICENALDLNEYGYIDIYRKGNLIGEGDVFTIKVNDEVYGSIKNKERLRIIAPYGTHTLKSVTPLGGVDEGISVTLNPSQKIVYVNGYLTAKVEFGYIGPQANKFKFEVVDASVREANEPLPISSANTTGKMLVSHKMSGKVENNLNGFGPSMVYRVKCPNCAQAINTTASGCCPICSTTINWDNYGFVDIYRMAKKGGYGNAARGDIHVDNSYMGSIANQEVYRLAIPYGNHRVKFFQINTEFDVSLSQTNRIKRAKIYTTMGWSTPHVHFDEISESEMPIKEALPANASPVMQPAMTTPVQQVQPVSVTPVAAAPTLSQPQAETMQIAAKTIFCTQCGNKLIVPITNSQSKTICNKCDSIVIYHA